MKETIGFLHKTAKCWVHQLVFVFLTFTSVVFATGTYDNNATADGSADSPYQIRTAEQLDELGRHSEDWDKCFILTANIDMDPNITGIDIYSNSPIAYDTNDLSKPFEGIGFSGSFDGDGYYISNIYIEADGKNNVGLFGCIDGGEVVNLYISTVIKGNHGAGGLVGLNTGMISKCSVYGQIHGISEVGGLAGINLGTINQSFAHGLVKSVTRSGGFVGVNGDANSVETAEIENCYSYVYVTDVPGQIPSESFLGGFAGYNNGSIIRCHSSSIYFSDNNIMNDTIGGFVGGASKLCSNCIWDVNRAGFGTAGDNNYGAIGLSTEQMEVSSTFTDIGWDFVGETENGVEDIWDFNDYYFPTLAWPYIKYDGGSGTAEDPYRIRKAEHLDRLRVSTGDWNKHFIVTKDIDLAGKTYSRAVMGRDGSNASSFQGTPFTGSFDGNGHVIKNLTIDVSVSGYSGDGYSYIGFVGKMEGANAEIKNLGLENVNINSKKYSKENGGLCGSNSGTISNCYITGTVRGGEQNEKIGGLCGRNFGTITNCYSRCSVSSDAQSKNLGVLCGYNNGDISKCYSAGSVIGGEETNLVAALCGNNYEGTITDSYFYLLGGPDNQLGKALNNAEVLDQTKFTGFDFTGNVDDGTEDIWTIDNGRMPKLSWQKDEGPLLPDPIVTTLNGSGNSWDPFEINSHDDFMEFCNNKRLRCGYYILNANVDLVNETFYVSAVKGDFGGHLDGNNKIISNITIQAPGDNKEYLGFFCVISASVRNLGIENIFISCGDSDNVGGLCGFNNKGEIINCYSVTELECGNPSEYLGGLCGLNTGLISQCYANNSIVNRGYWRLGGICGGNSGTVIKCYSIGSVGGGRVTGGICGNNSGSIIDCYSLSQVSGNDYVGGVCGYQSDGMISGSYSAGTVTGVSHRGGVCGTFYGDSLTNCFWDIETTGTTDNSIGEGKTTAEMQDPNTFINDGWDLYPDDGDGFDWFMSYNGYPFLHWQQKIAFDGDTEVTLALNESATVEIDVYGHIDGTYNWTLTGYESCEWIKNVNPISNSSSGPEDSTTVTISIDAAGQDVGEYSCDLILSADNGDRVKIPVKLNIYNRVDLEEFAVLAQYWLASGCDESQPCSAADWFVDGTINLLDLVQLAKSWFDSEVAITMEEIKDNFESGDFSAQPWQFSGDSNWSVVSDDVYEGSYCAKSDPVERNQTSSMMLNVNLRGLNTVSFACKSSGRAVQDFLRFYIDGVEKFEMHGTFDWRVEECQVTDGEHIFEWRYSRNSSDSTTVTKSAWIDNIRVYKK